MKGNCAKGRSKEALQINRELNNIKAQIIKHYQHLSDREAFVTAEMVRNSYQGFGSEYETLLSAFDKDIAAYLSTDRGLANGTIWQRCMWLKGVVMRAHYNGKIPRRSALGTLAPARTRLRSSTLAQTVRKGSS